MDSEEMKQRTKKFGHRCVKLAVALPKTDLGIHIRRQLIRCATSVGANYRAACLAQSRPTFATKISIVLEEADESHFWIEFALDEGLVERDRVEPLMTEAQELVAIFAASRKTAQKD